MSNRYTRMEDRSLLHLSGAGTRDFLQNLITADIQLLSPQQAIYGALLSPQGKYFADFFLAESSQAPGIWLDTDSTLADALLTALTRYKMRAEVTITRDTTHHLYAAWGELAQLNLAETPGNSLTLEDGTVAYTDPRLAAMGARFISPRNHAENMLQLRGFAYVPASSYETHRLHLGIPHSTQDFIEGKSLLLENGMEYLHGVTFDKGCFVGQEVTARSKYRANLRKLLYRVVTRDSHQLLPASGTIVTTPDGKEAGILRSVQAQQGMALLRIEAVESGETLSADGIALHAALPQWWKTNV